MDTKICFDSLTSYGIIFDYSDMNNKKKNVTNKQMSNSRAEPPRTVAPRVVELADLLCGHREVRLRHGSEEYRLRVTQNNKLILTK